MRKRTTITWCAGFTTPASALVPIARTKRKNRPRRLCQKGPALSCTTYDHSQCPNDGHELQVQNMTVMPSLRLTEDAEDIASYLITQKKQEPASYPDAAFMDDPSLKEEGKSGSLLRCGGCHGIAGMEDEGRIGTELTLKAASPSSASISRCSRKSRSVAARTQANQKKRRLGATARWSRKRTLVRPQGILRAQTRRAKCYDQGKVKTETEALRMPNVHLNKEQVST